MRTACAGALDAFAGDLDGRDALAVLAIAPTPADVDLDPATGRGPARLSYRRAGVPQLVQRPPALLKPC